MFSFVFFLFKGKRIVVSRCQITAIMSMNPRDKWEKVEREMGNVIHSCNLLHNDGVCKRNETSKSEVIYTFISENKPTSRRAVMSSGSWYYTCSKTKVVHVAEGVSVRSRMS